MFMTMEKKLVAFYKGTAGQYLAMKGFAITMLDAGARMRNNYNEMTLDGSHGGFMTWYNGKRLHVKCECGLHI